MQATGEAADSGIGMLMNLRKCANHPLLIRNQYDEHKLEVSKYLNERRNVKGVDCSRLLPDSSRPGTLVTSRRWSPI